ncbi:MAG TPA: ABC transporter substrate-binding protein [Pyrinomonadaceae bacterium]|nr:ABC transporter substrate-binding protein [Pyrinomonadaceae bacterium]
MRLHILILIAAALCVSAVQSSPESRPLTPAERRGRAIYLRGEVPGNKPLMAMVGDLEVPAATINCAGCHGRRGEGKTEGGVAAGNLTWSNLTKSYGHTHPTGRKHGAFNESSFMTAVVRGVDPSGNNLNVAMPRYRLSIEDMNDLIAYIKRLELDRDPGLTSESIDVGVPLPAATTLAGVSQAIRQVMSAYFDDLNARGGIYNRKIKFHFTEGGADMSTSLRNLSSQNQVFAFIGGVSAGADKEIAALAREEEIPFIGPATLLTPVEHPPNRYVFYLLPGVAEQAAALINFADQQLGAKKQRAAVLFPPTELPSAAAEAAMARAKEAGWTNIVKLPYSADPFDANKLAQQLKTEGAANVFIFGGTDVADFLRAASAIEWTPNVLSLGALTSRDLAANVPASFTKKVFLAFPTVPTDVTPDAVAEYRALAEKYKLPAQHTAAQLGALAAAKTFVEGLKRAGADLSREQLVVALEGLYEYDTGLTPKLIFGPNRHVGAAGAYIITINSETKEFVSASGWVAAN